MAALLAMTNTNLPGWLPCSCALRRRVADALENNVKEIEPDLTKRHRGYDVFFTEYSFDHRNQGLFIRQLDRHFDLPL